MDKLGNWEKNFGEIGKLGRSTKPKNEAILEVTTTSLQSVGVVCNSVLKMTVKPKQCFDEIERGFEDLHFH